MNNTIKILGIALVFVFTSCSQNKYIVAPSFTDVSKISALKKGMSISDVNKTLGISPYDMYVSDDGYSIFTYNYRLKERRIPVDHDQTFIDKQEGDPTAKSINSEEAQNYGVDYYTDPKRIFVSFKEDKLFSVISEDGLQKASQIIAITGSLAVLKNDPQIKVLPDALLHNNIVVPLDDKGNFLNNPQSAQGVGSGVIYMGNGNGISTLPAPNSRNINSNSQKTVIRNKRNKSSEVIYNDHN
jgi:hypothetical protein